MTLFNFLIFVCLFLFLFFMFFFSDGLVLILCVCVFCFFGEGSKLLVIEIITLYYVCSICVLKLVLSVDNN